MQKEKFLLTTACGLEKIVEEMDLRSLYGAYKRRGRKAANNPATMLKSIKEIKYEHLFVDGTKLEANANKYTFVWKKSATKYETRLLNRLEKRTAELCNTYGLFCKEPKNCIQP